MSHYLLNLLTPATAQAGNDLHQKDAAALDRLAAECRKAARRKAGSLVDAADVAQVAALVAAPLVLAGRAEDDAARIATHRATVAALRDAGHNEAADRLDDAGEDGTAEGAPLARLAAPVEVRADRGTHFTDRDRIGLAAECLDPEHVAALRTMLAAEVPTGQGTRRDYLPAAALAAAAGKAYSGRAKSAALALKRDALAAFQQAYAGTLAALDYSRPRAPWTCCPGFALLDDCTQHDTTCTATDRLPAAVLAAALVEDTRSNGPVRRDSMSRGDTRTSGPAGPVALLVLGFPVDAATGDLLSLVERATPSLPPFQPSRGQAKREAGFLAPEAGTTVPARPVAGVRAGTQYGPAGTLAGFGTAQRPAAPRKRRREGAVGGSMTRA